MARSIRLATEAGQWEIVAALATELRALRLADAGAVDLGEKRRAKGR